METTNCSGDGDTASTVPSKKGVFARRLSLDSIFQSGANSTPSAPSPSPKGLGWSLHRRFSAWGWGRRSNSVVGNISNLGVVQEKNKKPKGSTEVSTPKKRRASAGTGPATIVINYTDGNTDVNLDWNTEMFWSKRYLLLCDAIIHLLPLPLHVNVTFELHGANGAQLKELLAQAAMEYRISSYRVIMDSARAILNSDGSATSIGESIDSGEEETNSLPEGLITVPVSEDAQFKTVYQLLKSERLYVNRLQSVLDSYAEPLRKFSSLSVEDHRVLFVCLEPIVSLSAMVNSKLEDALKSWDPGSTKIGNLFSSTFWNHYEDYFHEYPKVKNLLKEKFETEDGFVEFCDLRQGKSKYSLEQLLCLPVQRIPEYDKYLNELLEKTDPSHSDYEDLKKAATKVRNMVREHEEEMGNMDNEKRMERVQEKFPHDDLQLSDIDTSQRKQLASRRKSAPGAVLFKSLGAKSKSTSNLLASGQMGKKENDIFRPGRNCNLQRQYLMEGHVEFATGMQTQERYMFLFSDLLLVAKQKSNTTFKLKHRIRVCELWISSCIDDVAVITRPPDRSFVLGWPTTNVVATFRSVELKDTWLNKLQEQIQEEKRKEMPKEIQIEILYKDLGQAFKLSVETNTEARDIVQQCLEELRITDAEPKDYQLWVKGEKDEYQYPLIGHELPYSIKLSHIRDLAKANEEEMLSGKEIQKMMEENQSRKLEFILKHSKKPPKKTSLEDGESHHKSKKKGKSPIFNIFRRPREEKKPQGKLFGHNLQDITTAENPIPKPVMDLMIILFREGPHTVGILRKSPNAKLLKELREKMDNGEECFNEPCPPLVVGGLLKEFLRSIPQSLMYEDLFDDWITVHNLRDGQEKMNKMKQILEKLPPCHFSLLQHLICVLFYIDKKSEENKMTAYNLSVCIAPSLLWSKGNRDPLATPAALIQCMIQSFMYIFGEESLNLFGEPIEKTRQDSSTDSDSMHSILSTHSGMRRDDSSIDSLEREIHYSGDMDSSPKLRYSHLSPSNLSRDSGLMLSDTMLYEEENNNNNVDRREYSRSTSHYMERDIDPTDQNEVSHSLDSNYFYSYEGQIPVPPPRKSRKKGIELTHQSPNLDLYRRHNHYTQHPQQYSGMGRNEKSRSLYSQSMSSDAFSQLSKQRSTESLKSVEEGSEVESVPNVRDWGQRSDMGTLIKSDSGAHLFMDAESLYPFSSHSHHQKSPRARLTRSAIIESTPPISPDSKYSLNSSHDSVLSDSSGSYVRQFSHDRVFSSLPHTPESDCDIPSWIGQKSKDSGIEIYSKRQYSQDDSEVGLKSGDFTHKFEGHLPEHDGHHISPVSPRVGAVASAISHSPLGVRHSFPLETSTAHVGSGSNTSKEAEDIIKSPKISVTYCSTGSFSKLDEEECLKKPGSKSPHLDLYNSSASSGSQLPLKTLKYMGRLGTSPPPRVVLHGFKQNSDRKENLPMRASHDSAIVSQVRRSNFDATELRERAPSKVESVSSDSVSLEESDSEEEKIRYTTMLSLSLRPKSPQKIIDEPHVKSPPKQFELPLRRSEQPPSCNEAERPEQPPSYNEAVRPEQPPSYNEALRRNFLIKQGILTNRFSPSISDVDSIKQKEASARALQLYQQSVQKYQEQVSDKKFGPPSQQFEVKLDAVGEKADENLDTEASGVSEDDYVSLAHQEKDPKKLYQKSLEQYMQQQQTSPSARTTRSLMLAPVSGFQEGQSPALSQSNEGMNMDLLDVRGIQRSFSDVGDHVNKRDSRLRQTSPSRGNSPADSNMSVSPSISNRGVSPTNSNSGRSLTNSDGNEGSLTKRPDQPPPYLDPPSYKRELADSSPRHTFRTVERKPQIVGDSQRLLTARSMENLSQKLSKLTYKRESFEDEPFCKKSVIVASSVRNSPQRVSNSSRDSSRSITPQRDSTWNSGQRDSRTLTTNRDSASFVHSRDSPQTVVLSRDSTLTQPSSQDSLASGSCRSCASSLEPSVKRITPLDVVSASVDMKNVTKSQRDSPVERRLRRSSVDSVDSRTSVNNRNVASSNNSSRNSISNNAPASTNKSTSAKELPWSVKKLRSQFDTNKSSATETDPLNEEAIHQNSTTTPPYNNPPPFPGKTDNLRASSSSISSNGSAKTSQHVTLKNKFGPQAWDSFSSTDESDSSHHSFYHRRDTSSSSECEEWSYTDISYV